MKSSDSASEERSAARQRRFFNDWSQEVGRAMKMLYFTFSLAVIVTTMLVVSTAKAYAATCASNPASAWKAQEKKADSYSLTAATPAQTQYDAFMLAESEMMDCWKTSSESDKVILALEVGHVEYGAAYSAVGMYPLTTDSRGHSQLVNADVVQARCKSAMVAFTFAALHGSKSQVAKARAGEEMAQHLQFLTDPKG